MESADADAFVAGVERADGWRFAVFDGARLGFGAGFAAPAPVAAGSVAVESVAAGSVASGFATVAPRVFDLGVLVADVEREVDFLAGVREGAGEPDAGSADNCDDVAAGSTADESVFLVRVPRGAVCEPAGFAAVAGRGVRGVDTRAFDGALGSSATAALDGSAVVFSSGFESTG